jgi:hypothetical protein
VFRSVDAESAAVVDELENEMELAVAQYGLDRAHDPWLAAHLEPLPHRNWLLA